MKPRVGISSCLLGEAVRYDGGHKFSPVCAGELRRHFELVSICPEVGIGMGVPRDPIQLVDVSGKTRALGVADRRLDVTGRLETHADAVVDRPERLSGYIFMEESPSCGLHTVKVSDQGGRLKRRDGRGIYARRITGRCPGLPVEEAGRLNDPGRRRAFIARVLAFHRRGTGSGDAPVE